MHCLKLVVLTENSEFSVQLLDLLSFICVRRSLYKWVPQQDDEEDEESLTQGLGRRGSAAAAMAAAVAAAAAAGAGGGRRAGVSDSFLCFDADPQVR
jgi:hypothetical protein